MWYRQVFVPLKQYLVQMVNDEPGSQTVKQTGIKCGNKIGFCSFCWGQR